MRSFILLAGMVSAILFWRIVSPEQQPKVQCGVPPLNKKFSRLDIIMAEHRLVGGTEARPHAWPWTGQVLSADRHQCGCALIEPDIVLTAAHCFARSRNPARYKVLLGGHTIYSGTLFEVQNISIHTLYQTRASAYDVALLKIVPRATLSDTISPICLPSAPPPVNRMCVVTGWGERANALREIHVPIIPTTTCNNFRHYAGRVHSSSMVCAGYNNGLVDSCQGDSGGPLQCQNSAGAWEIQGVVSWGIGCAQPAYPGVYSKIYTMVPWIRLQSRLLSIPKNV